MISRLVTTAAVIGVAATFAISAPASAAARPTLSGPAEVKGYTQFTMTGTADPGSTVELWESAIGFNDLKPADDWEAGGGTVKATADSAGKFSIRRWLDSGFYFEVHQGDVVSNRITVHSRVDVAFWVESKATGSVTAHGDVHPGEPGLPVRIEHRNADGTYTSVKTTTTMEPDGDFTATVTGVTRGDQTFRAYVGGDDSNGVLGAYSVPHSTWVEGSAPAPTPTKPTPTPTTSTPAAGSVQFTKIQYDAPGTDSGSNGSLNTEWVKLTNKTKTKINLNGWTVKDASGITYKFSGNVYLNAGASIFVLSGKGTNTTTHRYWGRAGKSGYVWGNTSDTATLRTNTSKVIDTCKWTKLGPGYSMC